MRLLSISGNESKRCSYHVAIDEKSMRNFDLFRLKRITCDVLSLHFAFCHRLIHLHWTQMFSRFHHGFRFSLVPNGLITPSLVNFSSFSNQKLQMLWGINKGESVWLRCMKPKNKHGNKFPAWCSCCAEQGLAVNGRREKMQCRRCISAKWNCSTVVGILRY